MTDRINFESKRAELFSRLLDAPWNDKKIWEHIRDGKLTATPAFEGDLYQTAAVKIMVVGRDLNGWEEPLGNCSTLEKTVESITNQTGAFETFVNENGVGNGPRKYYHKNSKFFRFVKHVLEYLGESDPEIDKTFYHDGKQWNQRFVWANLYCIAPRSPESSEKAHPDNAMVKQGINEYVDLMELYVNHYKPDVVIFITDVDGWFIRWKREKSFKHLADNYQEVSNNDTIAAIGNIGESRIIVCKRPDRRGTSYETVKGMAKTVAEWIL